MTHADDDGLRLPPKIAPYQVVILPIIHQEEDKEAIMLFVEQIKSKLQALRYDDEKIRIHIDNRDMRGGDKAWSWFKKGVPLRIEVGKREAESQKISIVKRTDAYRDRCSLEVDELGQVVGFLDQIQNTLLEDAKSYRDENTCHLNTKEEVEAYFKNDKKMRGFVIAPFCGAKEIESEWCKANGISARCILPGDKTGACILTGSPAPFVVFARAY